jgi:hypothetical protein
MINYNITTQLAKDKEGNVINIDSLERSYDKGLKCGLFHLITGRPVEACCLGEESEITPYFREHSDRNQKGGGGGESDLLQLVRGLFDQIHEIEIEGFSSKLTNHKKKYTFKVVDSEGQTIKRRVVDVFCDECIFKIVITNEILPEKACLLEELPIPVIEVRFLPSEKDRVYSQYKKMELGEVLKDIADRCSLRKPIKQAVTDRYAKELSETNEKHARKIEFYKQLLKQSEDKVVKARSEATQGHAVSKKRNNQRGRRITGFITDVYNNSIIVDNEILNIHSSIDHLKPVFKGLWQAKIEVTVHFIGEEGENKVYAIS